MEHDDVVRLYGPWRHRTPADVVELLSGYPGGWWIAGGWAIQAFTGVARPHGDIDPSVPRSDAALLRRHLRGRLDVWAADGGALRPVVDEDVPVPSSCNNLWLRESGSQPREYDVLLMDVTDGRWTYKRDRRVSLPLGDILWHQDGIDYLRPEIQLLHKAPGLRTNDQLDFDACLPLMNGSARSWLREALTIAHPGHAWIDALASAPPAEF